MRNAGLQFSSTASKPLQVAGEIAAALRRDEMHLNDCLYLPEGWGKTNWAAAHDDVHET